MSQPVPEPADYCWPIDTGCCSNFGDYSEEVQHRASVLAAQTLHMLTAYRVGGCPQTVRPCRAQCVGGDVFGGFGSWINPAIVQGVWMNIPCGCGVQPCGCSPLCEIQLPGPIGSIESIWVDGEEVDSGAYRVDNGNLLVRTDGQCWPDCQDLTADIHDDGAFAITYLRGIPVDDLGAYAAGLLACEYAKACSGGKCRLPEGVTSIARQGVTFTIDGGAFPGGMTGIREVDAWVSRYNPRHAMQVSSVWTPDAPRVRVTTWERAVQ